MTDIFLYGPPAGVNDVILCDPTVLCVALVAQAPVGGGGGGRYLPVGPRGPWRKDRRRPEPVVVAHSLYEDLGARYGADGGRAIYFAMERELKGPFAPGKKYDATQRPPQDADVATPPERLPVIGEARKE